jgi:glutamyl-tRNA reductase
MSIFLVGLNHKTAPVEVREQLAFTDEACAEGLKELVDGQVIAEAIIISTCNRVEILSASESIYKEECPLRLSDFLSRKRTIPPELFNKHLYAHVDEAAVRHMFRVASSLDSMVVGEPQILGQVKHAYSIAVETGTVGRVLHKLVPHAFRVAKRVRSETGIASSAVSISYTAVELGRKIFGSLEGSTIMLVGAGEMAELAAQHLVNAGAKQLLIANRTYETGKQLAEQFGGKAIEYSSLPTNLAKADIIICSTAAKEYVITPELMNQAMEIRRNRPAFIIDISVPRNVDPAVGEIENLFLFDIDDLEAVVVSNLREREREADRAESIIESEILEFQQSLRNLDIGPTIGALREKLQDIARAEFERQRSKLGNLSPEQERAIEAMLQSTINKISHPVITRMRHSFEMEEQDSIQAWRDIFGLEE